MNAVAAKTASAVVGLSVLITAVLVGLCYIAATMPIIGVPLVTVVVLGGIWSVIYFAMRGW